MEDRKDFNPDDVLDRAVDAILRGPTPDELSPDRVAELTAVVRNAADRPYPITLTNRIKNMKLRTRIAVAAAALIACVGLMSWLAPAGGTALAFVDMIEAISNVETAKWKSTSIVTRPNSEPSTAHEIGMFMAPSHERMERTEGGHTSIAIWDGSGDKALNLIPTAKIAKVMNLKNFPKESPLGTSFLSLRNSVLNAKNGGKRKAESLGVKDVDGRRAEGFRMKHGATETTIWADPKTSLPIRVEIFTSGDTEVRIVMTDFEVGIDLDKSLFSLDPPGGYSVEELQLEMPKHLLSGLAWSLGKVAELNGGVFPPTVRGEEGIDGIHPRVRAAWEKKYGEDPVEALKAGAGAAEIQKEANELAFNLAGAFAIVNQLSPKHDWHYAGKDVKLNTPDRPIFWMKVFWKDRKGGTYEVIYADLSVKDVAAKDVPKVPEAEGSPKK
jgi:outer membrane lipoprotein-sorting protein